ncbi:MAG: hypothetical protein KGL40_12625 [Rhodocyclaceae bacterium]|nr:hypothetical protein [Rhodocyclaceae bacterium]
MGKLLEKTAPVVFANGDKNKGPVLVKVATVTTTPKSDNKPKPVTCPKYKTLCQALQELAAYERAEGPKFLDNVIDFKNVVRGRVVVNHHPIDGGSWQDVPPIEGMINPIGQGEGIEDTEFRDPRPTTPYFVDIEYVEVGYVLRKKGYDPIAYYIGWTGVFKPSHNAIKNFVHRIFGEEERETSSPLSHKPNLYGLLMGKMIAEKYLNLTKFTEEYCKNAC